MQMPSLVQLMEETFKSFKGYMIVDREGTIVSVTRNYAEFLGYSAPKEMIGQLVTAIIPDSKMMRVVKSGMADIADIWMLQGESLVINRLPIWLNGSIVGAIAYDVFPDMKEVEDFARRYVLRERDSGLVKHIRETWKAKYSIKSLIGINPAMKTIRKQINLVADADCPVLITGESGTGKELIAHALHSESERREEPFVRLNCASVPESLWESELFGYEEGAFTGAKRGGKLGKFEIADRGTIFLDEIAEMPMVMQAKLLRVLQEMEIERVGGEKLKRINVRLVAATNRDLEEEVKNRRFREDLFYRLAVFEIYMPPLRERKEDIPFLVRHMTQKIGYVQKYNVTDVHPEVFELFKAYDWPGNIRELENTLERACMVKGSGPLDVDTVLSVKLKLAGLAKDLALASNVPAPKGTLKQAEKTAIIEALALTGNSRTAAADMLGIHRTSLYNKIKEYGITFENIADRE